MKLKKKMLVCILLLICICSLAGCKKGSQKDNEKSGMIKTSFDILEQREVPIETSLFGNAICVSL